MEKKSNSTMLIVVGIIAALIVAGVAVYAFTVASQSDDDATQQTTSEADNSTRADPQVTDSPDTAQESETVIVFTDDGFTPREYTAPAGQPITVRNDSTRDLQFASDDHPTHQQNPEINLGVLAPGQSGAFTPDGPGVYEFHDHLDASKAGTLTVE